MSPTTPYPRATHPADQVVRSYLESPEGRHTPPAVRRRLYRLAWERLGVSGPVPTVLQVHLTRCWLEDLALDEARRLWGRLRPA